MRNIARWLCVICVAAFAAVALAFVPPLLVQPRWWSWYPLGEAARCRPLYAARVRVHEVRGNQVLYVACVFEAPNGEVQSVSTAPPFSPVPGYTSRGWSGYVFVAGVVRYRMVGGEWRVPAVNCSSVPGGSVSVWVGVNGWQFFPGLFQTGTESHCVNGTPVYQAVFSDDALDDAWQIEFAVKPGDLVRAHVEQVPSGKWRYFVEDETNGVSAWGTKPVQYVAREAEWIVEDSGLVPVGTGYYPLADFTPVTFSDLAVGESGDAWTFLPDLSSIEMVQSDGTVKAGQGPLRSRGAFAVFTVRYRPEG
jgi:hypothetical protein